MTLKVGGIYLTRSGAVVRIQEIRVRHMQTFFQKHVAKGTIEFSHGAIVGDQDWTEEGQFNFADRQSPLDIVDEHPIYKCRLGQVIYGN